MLEIHRLAVLSAIIYMNVNSAPFPEYIVYPKLLEAREINGQKVLHIKDGLTLTLEKLSVLPDSLVFTETNDGVATQTILNGTELQQNLYQDRVKMAAVAVKEIDDTIEVMGAISNKLRITPLPLMARSEEGHLAHRIYEVEPSINHEEKNTVLSETLPEERARTKRQTRSASMRHVPDTFLVEVHMMVDEPHYRMFEQREHLVTYLALTIVLVNMRYEDTSGPNIQFLLTSIQQEQGFAITFEEYDIDWPKANRTYADADTTFDNLLEKYGRSPADITVAVTGLTLADAYQGFTYDDARVQGKARLGGVCNTSYSMVMVEDVAWTYGMVARLPHELGHALGAPHDGIKHVWNRDLPPKSNCRADGHFIMNEYEPGNAEFSKCSKEHMIAFISTLTESCFNIKAKKNCTTEVKELPGASMNLTDFCKKAHPNFMAYNVERSNDLNSDCLFRCCSPTPNNDRTCMKEHLPDGADCGNKKRCVRGTCGYYDEYGAPTTPKQGA